MARGQDNLIPADQAIDAGPVAFNLNDLRAMASGLLRKTKGTCEKMLADARGQVGEMEKRARAEGLEKGRAEGKAKGEEEGLKKGMADAEKKVAAMVETERAAFRENLAPAAASMSSFMGELENWRAQLLGQAEADLLRLAMDIARRVVRAELAVHPESVVHILHEAIALVTHRTDVDVYAHPEDVALLEAEVPEVRAAFPDLGSVRFMPDPRVERGGVIARTRDTEVDLQLATRLSAFEQALLGVSGPDAEAPWNHPAAQPFPESLPPPEPTDFAAEAPVEAPPPDAHAPEESPAPPRDPAETEAQPPADGEAAPATEAGT